MRYANAVFLSLLCALSVSAAPPALVIHGAEPAEFGNHIVIRGSNLVSDARTPQATFVFLGTTMLPVLHATANEIVASVPPALPAGSYLLTVAFGSNDRESDAAWFTLGAVGPPGPLVQCFEGDAVECYTGPAATRNVGQCRRSHALDPGERPRA